VILGLKEYLEYPQLTLFEGEDIDYSFQFAPMDGTGDISSPLKTVPIYLVA
jgi:hypothetical protein